MRRSEIENENEEKQNEKRHFHSVSRSVLYPGRESNPHTLQYWILNPARLPIPPPGHGLGTEKKSVSEGKDSAFIQIANLFLHIFLI